MRYFVSLLIVCSMYLQLYDRLIVELVNCSIIQLFDHSIYCLFIFFSEWLDANNQRWEEKKKSMTVVDKAVIAKLQWVRSIPKTGGTKSKAWLKLLQLAPVGRSAHRNYNGESDIHPPRTTVGECCC